MDTTSAGGPLLPYCPDCGGYHASTTAACKGRPVSTTAPTADAQGDPPPPLKDELLRWYGGPDVGWCAVDTEGKAFGWAGETKPSDPWVRDCYLDIPVCERLAAEVVALRAALSALSAGDPTLAKVALGERYLARFKAERVDPHNELVALRARVEEQRIRLVDAAEHVHAAAYAKPSAERSQRLYALAERIAVTLAQPTTKG